MFVAQLAKLCGPASSRTVSSGPLLKLGGSLTGVTLMTNVCAALVSMPPLAVPPLSCSFTVTVAVPLALGAAVKLRVPDGVIVGWVVTRALLLLLTMKSSAWPGGAGGPAEMLVAQLVKVCGPASSSTVSSGPLVKLGASLTGVTVMVNVTPALVSIPPFAV